MTFVLCSDGQCVNVLVREEVSYMMLVGVL